MKTWKQQWAPVARALGAGSIVLTLTLLAAWRVWSQSNAPVLAIAPLGTNQFQVTVTNGVAGAAYELMWGPSLNVPLSQWGILQTNPPGQTNFGVNCGQLPVGFFMVRVGQCTNGIWDYQWANPNDPSLGALSIVIDSPTNGMVLQ